MPPHSYTHTLYIPWVYILKQLLMEIYGRCSLTRPRTLLILNYIMLHHTIIFNLELHVQISKRCICGSENSSKIKIAIKNEKFWAEKAVRLSIIHEGNDWKIAQTSLSFTISWQPKLQCVGAREFIASFFCLYYHMTW